MMTAYALHLMLSIRTSVLDTRKLIRFNQRYNIYSSNIMSNPADTADGGDSIATTVVSCVVIGLAVIYIALRFYTRFYTTAGFSWNDWFILIALLSTILAVVLLLWATRVDPDGALVACNSGPNYHYTPEDMFYLKLSFIASVLYFTISSSTKLSILLMYNRLFSVSNSFRYQVFAIAGLVIGFWIGCTVAALTHCKPLELSWIYNSTYPRHCSNYNIFWMASGIIEACIDLVIIVVPVRIILRLHMSKRNKVIVVAVFALGVFVIVTGLVKVKLGYVPGGRVPSYMRTTVWTMVHVGMAIVCACLPVCWPLVIGIGNFTGASIKRWYGNYGWRPISRNGMESAGLSSRDMSSAGIVEA
ncbi:hypothetical protein F5B20DRAFT_523998 [Whalleya microplaca]|nr:hypothetical protein F5B20DRAFT_523998 [Whalleya microplaca]